MLNTKMNDTNRLPIPARKVRRLRKRGFKKLKQKGRNINLTTRVSSRLARLVQTEAAIHKTSVGNWLACILSERYSAVR